MKKLIPGIVLLAGMLLLRSGNAADDPQVFSLSFNAAPLTQVLTTLAAMREINIVVSPEINQTLSLNLSDVDWQTAVEVISQAAELNFSEIDNVLMVTKKSPSSVKNHSPHPSAGSADFGALKKMIFPLRFVSATELRDDFKQLILTDPDSPARVSADIKNNCLVVWASVKQLDEITAWISRQDTASPQIEISAHILSINQQQLQELGVSWQTWRSNTEGILEKSGRFNVPLGLASPSIGIGGTFTHLKGDLLRLELSALEQENLIEIMASPRLVTSNLKMASIKQGTDIPYLVADTKKEFFTVEFKEAVLGMQVTPEILGKNRIRLRLHLSQNVAGKSMTSGNEGPPVIDKQEIDTEVIVDNGQTLALGGIFQHQRDRLTSNVPWLGKLPIIGYLFRQELQQHKKRELVVFITPTLLFPSVSMRNAPG